MKRITLAACWIATAAAFAFVLGMTVLPENVIDDLTAPTLPCISNGGCP